MKTEDQWNPPHIQKQMIYVDFGEEIKEGYLLRRREEVEGEN